MDWIFCQNRRFRKLENKNDNENAHHDETASILRVPNGGSKFGKIDSHMADCSQEGERKTTNNLPC